MKTLPLMSYPTIQPWFEFECHQPLFRHMTPKLILLHLNLILTQLN